MAMIKGMTKRKNMILSSGNMVESLVASFTEDVIKPKTLTLKLAISDTNSLNDGNRTIATNIEIAPIINGRNVKTDNPFI